jgi:hypothetical protein
LNLEGFDAVQMDDLGGVIDENLAAQMEILAENEYSGSGEDTVGADYEGDVYFSGRGTHNPVVTEFKAGAMMVYIGKGGDVMCLGYCVTVHGDIKGGLLSIQ